MECPHGGAYPREPQRRANSLDVSLSRRRRSFETVFDADSSALPLPPKPRSLLQHSPPLLARFGPMA